MNIGAPSKSCPHLHRSNGNTVRVMQKCESALQHVSGVPKRPPKNELRNCCIVNSPMLDPPKPAFPRYDPMVGSSDDAALNTGIFISFISCCLGFHFTDHSKVFNRSLAHMPYKSDRKWCSA